MVRTRMIAALAAGTMLLAGCAENEPAAVTDRSAAAASWAAITDLQKTDVVMGTGAEARPGSGVEVHYDGWLYDPAAAGHRGEKFDSSRERGKPFRFRIGSGMVIKGWDEGVTGMRAGGRRELVIPAAMGYGERGAGGGVIPAGAALVFDIELLQVE